MSRLFKTFTVMAMVAALAFSAMAASSARGGGTASEVGKVNLCHFEDHVAPTDAEGNYLDDRNGGLPGFWTVTAGSEFNPTSDDIYLTGDYIVRYDMSGDEFGLNNGQKALCYGNGGEFIQVSVNALDGHNAQLVFDVVLETYPTGWWK